MNSWISKLPWNDINAIAIKYHLDPSLIAAIIQTESGNDPFAVRFEPTYKWLYKTKENAKEANISEATEAVLQSCSFGLTQVMLAVAREYGLTGSPFKLLDPKINIEYCAKHLSNYFKKYNSEDEVIASYNAGSPKKTLTGVFKNQIYVDKIKIYKSEIEGSKWKA